MFVICPILSYGDASVDVDDVLLLLEQNQSEDERDRYDDSSSDDEFIGNGDENLDDISLLHFLLYWTCLILMDNLVQVPLSGLLFLSKLIWR